MQLLLYIRMQTDSKPADKSSRRVIGRDAQHRDRTDVAAGAASAGDRQCASPVEDMHQT